MTSRLRAYAPGAVLLAIALPAWALDRTLFWAAYLAAWWFCTGVALGASANVWIHNLTEGEWGEAIRGPSLALARAMPLLALLFVPLLFAMDDVWPWAADAARGTARWHAETSSPGMKSAWLSPLFFVVRSLVYLAIWVALEGLSRTPRFARSRPWSVAALMIYWITASLAAIDWIMSLMPLWYSTAFPPLAVIGQMLAGFAAASAIASLRAGGRSPVFRDLGNLLLVYVMSWAYIAFTQYLIIWAENLPHEISWYVARLDSGWYWVGWLLIVCHFFLPLLILLSRDAKAVSAVIAAVAVGLLVLHLVDVAWLVVPSLRPRSLHVLWLGPLLAAAFIALTSAPLRTEASRG